MAVKIIKTIYINLEKRLDKKKRTENGLIQSQNTNFERFDAVNGPEKFTSIIDLVKWYQNIEFHPFIFKKDNVKNTKRYRAKISCWLSHFLILKKIFLSNPQNNEDWILILEDDVKTMYSFGELQFWMKKTIAKHNRADIILCGDRVGVCGHQKTIEQISKYNKNKNYGLDCYLVRCQSIFKFINELYLNKPHNHCSIDNKIAELNANNTIHVVALEGPPYCICIDLPQKDSDIEIENTIENFSLEGLNATYLK